MADNTRESNFQFTAREGVSPEIAKITAALKAAAEAADLLVRNLGSIRSAAGYAAPGAQNNAGGLGATIGISSSPASIAAATSGTQVYVQLRDRILNADTALKQQITTSRAAEVASAQLEGRIADTVVQFRQQEEAASKSSSGIGALGQKMLNFGVGIVEYKALQFISDQFGNMAQAIDRSVEAATKLDIVQRSFANIFGQGQGSAELNKTMQAATDAAIPFDQMAQAQERLVTAGMNTQRVLPVMTALSAVVRGTGGSVDDLNGALNAFAQIQEKGKLQSEELVKQLGNRNVPAVQEVAKALNLSVAQVRDAVSAGTIDVNTFFDAFTQQANKDFGSMLNPINSSLDDMTVRLQNLQLLSDAAFGEATMGRRKAASESLLKTMEDPGWTKSMTDLGSLTAIITDPFIQLGAEISKIELQSNGLVHQILQNFVNVSNGFEVLFGGRDVYTSVEDLEKRLAGVSSSANVAGAGIADYANSEGDLSAQTTAATQAVTDQIAALQRQNTLLQQQKSLMDALNAASQARSDYQSTAAMAVDVLSSAGQSANQSLPGKLNALDQAYRNLQYTQAEQDNSNAVYDLQQGKKVTIPKIPSLVTPNTGRGSSYSPAAPTGISGYHPLGFALPGAGGYKPTVGWTAQIGQPQPNQLLVGLCTNCATPFVLNLAQNDPRMGEAMDTGLYKHWGGQ